MLIICEFQKPAQQSWSSPLEAHETALQLEKDVYQALLEVHAFATKNEYDIKLFILFVLTLSSSFRDPHLSDYVEAEFLDEQVKSIKEYADYITNLKRVGTGLGEYIFDKEELQA